MVTWLGSSLAWLLGNEGALSDLGSHPGTAYHPVLCYYSTEIIHCGEVIYRTYSKSNFKKASRVRKMRKL